ncbi:MAG: TlpA family protein disulfide reductase [Deltaproteobacteria bacterium]|nr:MAG: TlpA family protein disulfide reductase [Deltaproteobacteria bacterium]
MTTRNPIEATPRSLRIAALVLPLLLLLGLLAWQRPDPAAGVLVDGLVQLGGERVDRRAPDFELPGLDGTSRRLADHAGHLIFLNFWASWCEPCREEMPAMVNLARTLQRRPFAMVAVSLDEDPQALRDFLVQEGIDPTSMVILHDPEGRSAREYGTELLPETWLITPRGRVFARFQGALPWDDPSVIRFMERLMRAWQPPAP